MQGSPMSAQATKTYAQGYPRNGIPHTSTCSTVLLPSQQQLLASPRISPSPQIKLPHLKQLVERQHKLAGRLEERRPSPMASVDDCSRQSSLPRSTNLRISASPELQALLSPNTATDKDICSAQWRQLLLAAPRETSPRKTSPEKRLQKCSTCADLPVRRAPEPRVTIPISQKVLTGFANLVSSAAESVTDVITDAMIVALSETPAHPVKDPFDLPPPSPPRVPQRYRGRGLRNDFCPPNMDARTRVESSQSSNGFSEDTTSTEHCMSMSFCWKKKNQQKPENRAVDSNAVAGQNTQTEELEDRPSEAKVARWPAPLIRPGSDERLRGVDRSNSRIKVPAGFGSPDQSHSSTSGRGAYRRDRSCQRKLQWKREIADEKRNSVRDAKDDVPNRVLSQTELQSSPNSRGTVIVERGISRLPSILKTSTNKRMTTCRDPQLQQHQTTFSLKVDESERQTPVSPSASLDHNSIEQNPIYRTESMQRRSSCESEYRGAAVAAHGKLDECSTETSSQGYGPHFQNTDVPLSRIRPDDPLSPLAGAQVAFDFPMPEDTVPRVSSAVTILFPPERYTTLDICEDLSMVHADRVQGCSINSSHVTLSPCSRPPCSELEFVRRNQSSIFTGESGFSDLSPATIIDDQAQTNGKSLFSEGRINVRRCSSFTPELCLPQDFDLDSSSDAGDAVFQSGVGAEAMEALDTASREKRSVYFCSEISEHGETASILSCMVDEGYGPRHSKTSRTSLQHVEEHESGQSNQRQDNASECSKKRNAAFAG